MRGKLGRNEMPSWLANLSKILSLISAYVVSAAVRNTMIASSVIYALIEMVLRDADFTEIGLVGGLGVSSLLEGEREIVKEVGVQGR